jgi:hypothetical protein
METKPTTIRLSNSDRARAKRLNRFVVENYEPEGRMGRSLTLRVALDLGLAQLEKAKAKHEGK